jgi:hypothetical protein
MRIRFTPQAKAALRINLILLATFTGLDMLQIDSMGLGFLVGVLNYFYVLAEVDRAKS